METDSTTGASSGFSGTSAASAASDSGGFSGAVAASRGRSGAQMLDFVVMQDERGDVGVAFEFRRLSEFVVGDVESL